MTLLLHADIVILTALDKEFEAIAKCLGKTSKATSHSMGQYLTTSINNNVIALPMACGPGQLNAAAATVKVLNDLTPNWLLLIGIAGKLKRDVDLGDVMVADQVIDYELAKLMEIKKSEIRTVGYRSTKALVEAVKAVRNGWQANIKTKRPDRTKKIPKVHIGPIFCGNKVVAKQGFADELRRLHPSALGLEMESAGVTAMLEALPAPPDFLFIKVAVDNCDGAKNDDWHLWGAEVAASFCHNFLRNAKQLSPKAVDYDALVSLVQSRIAAGAKTKLNEAEERMLDSYVKRGIDIGSRALKQEFDVDVSSGDHFLFLAKPVFQSATRIYATSIDTVSRFWIDPKKKEAAYRYLEIHKPGAHRLFVFHDCETVQLYAKVLDEHAKKYQRVYYCTGYVYKRLLAEISNDGNDNTQRDFALLDCRAGDHKSVYFAELDEQHYKWRAVSESEGAPGNINVKSLINYFSRWEGLKEGEEDGGIFRWQIGAWQNHEHWANFLDEIFGDRTVDAFHLLYIRPHHDTKVTEEVRKVLLDVKRIMEKERHCSSGLTMSEKYHIKDVWFGENYAVKALDGRYLGDLRRGASPYRRDQTLGFILAMRFDSSDDLERFYKDRKHSEVRQQLYQALDNKVKFIYTHMDDLKASSTLKGSAQLVKLLYESVEDLESAYLNRFDFRSGEHTLHMVKHVTPVEFSPPRDAGRRLKGR